MSAADSLLSNTMHNIVCARSVKKAGHPNHDYNFVNSRSICKILSLLKERYICNKTHIGLLTYFEHRYVILPNWRNAQLHYSPMSDKTFSSLQLTDGKSVSRHVSVENGGHFEHLLWANSCKQLAFSSLFVPAHGMRFYCVGTWWSIGLPWLTAKL